MQEGDREKNWNSKNCIQEDDSNCNKQTFAHCHQSESHKKIYMVHIALWMRVLDLDSGNQEKVGGDGNVVLATDAKVQLDREENK